MKMLMLVLMLLPGVSHALSWTAGDYTVSVSTKLDLDTVGAYDFNNKNWLTGVGKDLFLVHRKGKKLAYLSGEQLFNFDEQGKGAFGLAVGLYTGSVAQYALDAVRHIVSDASLPVWVSKAGNYVSVEGGYGQRLFGTPAGQSSNTWTLGGKVKIPLDQLW